MNEKETKSIKRINFIFERTDIKQTWNNIKHRNLGSERSILIKAINLHALITNLRSKASARRKI